jgi:hypothetical protein
MAVVLDDQRANAIPARRRRYIVIFDWGNEALT